jgi:D-proline reductase (dithiol) PrdB
VSLVARHLEEHGIPTVVFGCARDIVEHCGVPRFVFTDFPLGNPTGRPFDPECQRHIVGRGLELLESATAPRTTIQSPYVWSTDTSWKEKVLTKEQPFLEGADKEKWLERKTAYKQLRSTGRV